MTNWLTGTPQNASAPHPLQSTGDTLINVWWTASAVHLKRQSMPPVLQVLKCQLHGGPGLITLLGSFKTSTWHRCAKIAACLYFNPLPNAYFSFGNDPAAADDCLDPPIISTPTNPSLARRRLGVEFSTKNHRKITFSALFQCCIRFQLRRDHHQSFPDRRKDWGPKRTVAYQYIVAICFLKSLEPCQTPTLTLISL